MALGSALPWDLDLDLDLDFDFASEDLPAPVHSVQNNITSLHDPLKDFESVGSSDPVLKPAVSGQPLPNFSPLFKDMPLFADHWPPSETVSSVPGSKSSTATDVQATDIKKPKRNRKPQKDRMAEVEQKVAALQQELKEGQQKQQQLLLQHAQLEGSVKSLQPSEEDQDGTNAPGIPNQNHRYYLLDTDGQMQHMKGTDIVNLGSEESIAIHQIYMDRLGDMLKKRRDGSRDEEIVTLAGQVCMATYLKGIYKPESMREILGINRHGLTLDDRKKVWSKVLAALKLSAEQQEKLLHFRRLFQPTQRQLLQTRRQLYASLQDTQTRACPSDGDLMKQTGACRRLVRQLQQNLHADQSILNRLFAQVFGEVLQGIQKAVVLVEFWPCPFDLVGLLNQLAHETGDTASEALLSVPADAASS